MVWPPTTHQHVQDEVQSHRDTLTTGRLTDASLTAAFDAVGAAAAAQTAAQTYAAGAAAGLALVFGA